MSSGDSEVNGKGIFICLDGLDACGKTTQSSILVRWLREKGYRASYTKEPSNGDIGFLIKKKILNRKNRVSPALEALLFAADRLDHVEREVEPALRSGEIIVSDRYIYSSIAYQGSAGLDLAWIETINRFALKPDLALFLDVKPELAAMRFKTNRSVMEKFETQKVVRRVFLKLVERSLMVRIDGNRSRSIVTNDIHALVSDLLLSKGFRIDA